MSDDSLDLETGDVAGGGEKKKKSGGLVPNLLKWILLVVGAIILIVTVVVVTMNIMNSNSPSVSAVPVSEEYIGKREVYSWYQNIDQIRTKTSDSVPANVLVEVVLGYKFDDQKVSAEITRRIIEIKDFLRRYFTQKTIMELKPQNEEQLRLEIKRFINDDILGETAIKDVRFLVLEVAEQ